MASLEQIRAALLETSQRYRDTRIHHCQMEAAAVEGDRCTLVGTLLDEEALATLMGTLADHFPEITFDSGGVQVLRTRSPQFLTVGTNVAALHVEPSLRTELLSQLLNGWSVELLAERGGWVYVRQTDGYLGWAYRSHLTAAPAPSPTHVVCAPVSLMRSAPDATSPLVSRLVAGTAVSPGAQSGPWAELDLAGDLRGWVPQKDLCALADLAQEEAIQRQQMVQDVARYTGVPYLWGGCTALGIDCSGMVQLLHRLVGRIIPRDADMQYNAGRPVEYPFRPGDLLFFCGESKIRAITHVGMSLGGWRMVHASIARNGVYEDDVQTVKSLQERFVGARTFLGAE